MPPDTIPTFAQMQDAPDDERVAALTMQASLPADFVSPADALGDDVWQQALMDDIANGGDEAAAMFRAEWNWMMTPQQRAGALARVALQREMDAFIQAATDASAKPPVDPVEYADRVRAARLERARRM